MTDVDEMIERAKKLVVSPAEREAQRRSFAYGNSKIENDRVTREMVDKAADEKPRS